MASFEEVQEAGKIDVLQESLIRPRTLEGIHAIRLQTDPLHLP